MVPLQRLIAAHPLGESEPYGRIKFSRLLPNNTPLYKVGKGKREFGAERALREAHRRFGGRCFHCNKAIEPGNPDFTLDHLRPKHDGGEGFLHNLVFACRPCNWSKGGNDLATFRSQIATEYLKALDEHLARCLKMLGTDPSAKR